MNEKYYNDKEVLQLLVLAQDIKDNPSQLHASFKHKDAPQTPEFDWNIYMERHADMMEQDRIKHSPLRQSKMALNALNADLTYDNRSKAKELIKRVVEELSYQEATSIQERQLDRINGEKERKEFLVSTYLTDEFWQNIGGEAPPPADKLADSQAVDLLWGASRFSCDPKTVPSRVLNEEKARYEQLRVSECQN